MENRLLSGGVPTGSRDHRSTRTLVLLGALSLVLMGLIAKNRYVASQREWNPAFVRLGRVESVLVFIGSSTCGNSVTPTLGEEVRRIRAELYSDAVRRGITFASIGIATDVVVRDGIDLLTALGHFDEIIVGRSWANLGAIRFAWDPNTGGRQSIPQILVVERVFERSLAGNLIVTQEKVVARVEGVKAIAEFSWERVKEGSG